MNEATYFRRELPGGARLVMESVPGRRSVAVGVWVRAGSRDELSGFEGAAHLIEHLAFKGTRRRTGREIALSVERVGGSLDAFTTKEHTCFYARVLEEDLALAVDVVCDLVGGPRLSPNDVDLERKVVLEELSSVEDNPEDLIGDLGMAQLWPGHILGTSILGTRESLTALNAEHVAAFHVREYLAPRAVVSVAGAADPERVEALFAEHLDLPRHAGREGRIAPSPAAGTLAVYPSDLAQVHLLLISPAPPDTDPRRRPVSLLAEILGGGMASRLFQSIREEAGLAYSVSAYTDHFSDAGLFGVGLGVSPARGPEALERAVEEIDILRRDGLRPGELDAAKAQVRGALIMGLESLSNRMTRLAHAEYRIGAAESVEQVLADYEALTEDDVMAAAAETLLPERQCLVALGPVRPQDLRVRAFTSEVELTLP
jgi:predicted Zn-dependent peptidase